MPPVPRLKMPIFLPLRSATVFTGLSCGTPMPQSITPVPMSPRTATLLSVLAWISPVELTCAKSTPPATICWMPCSEPPVVTIFTS
jgi:hypothetical protein